MRMASLPTEPAHNPCAAARDRVNMLSELCLLWEHTTAGGDYR